jgi:hypothetical protein
MREKKAIIICAIICTTLIICGVLFWPTLYRYDKFVGKLPVRINRLTGYTEILYASGWKRKVSYKEYRPIPKEEIGKIKVTGTLENEWDYKVAIYNGSEWTIKRLRLSIELSDSDNKKILQRIYETTADIGPFSTGSCFIKLMEQKGDPFLDRLETEDARRGFSKVRLEGALGYRDK